MSTMGNRADEPPPDDGPAYPANSFSLIAAGVRAMARRPVEVAVLWAASGALVFATQTLRSAVGAPLRFPGLSPAWLGFELLSIAPAAVLGTLGLRLFLGGGRAWRAPDRGFWICAGLLMAADLASFAQNLLIGFEPTSFDPGRMALRSGAAFAGLLLQTWIFARLLLWPIGALARDEAMTPQRSWCLMNGYVLGFVVAVVLINLPMTLWSLGYAMLAPHRHAPLGTLTPTFIVTFALIGPPVHLLERAMSALLYRARTGEAPRAALS
jgi:hypothetical protein